MQGIECAVGFCSNVHSKNSSRSFFRFPSDVGDIWVHRCGRQDPINMKTARMCSDHFEPHCFARDLKAELTATKPRKQLLPGSLPTLYLGKVYPDTLPTTDAGIRRRRKQTVKTENEEQQLLLQQHQQQHGEQTTSNLNSDDMSDYLNNTTEVVIPLSADNSITEKLRQKIMSLQRQNQQLKHHLSLARAKLVAKNSTAGHVKAPVQNGKFDTTENLKIVRNLKKIMTPGQIKCLVSGKNQTWWSSADIQQAVAIRCVSRKAYELLRNKFKYPFPGISTLRQYMSRFDCSQGLQTAVIKLVSGKMSALLEHQKLIAVGFDEMNIDQSVCMDTMSDAVLGPHKKVQVIMIRSITHNLKQPVYYDFDTRMSKSLLFEVIMALEAAHCKVVAMVSDLGAENRALHKQLQVTWTQPSFRNPSDDSRVIWCFADVPHLMKLLRNHLLDQGIILCGGAIINKLTFEKLVLANKTELNVAFRLTPQHLAVSGAERMRVGYALDILSHETARALSYVFPEETETASFLESIADLFLVFSSRVPYDGTNKLHCGFGLHLEDQLAALEKAEEILLTARVMGHKRLLPFQQGFLLSCASLRGLFSSIVDAGMSYCLTAHLNQDYIENFFSQVRGLGRHYNHPQPMEFKRRFRLLVIGANTIGLQKSVNIQQTEENNYISAAMLKGALDLAALPKRNSSVVHVNHFCSTVTSWRSNSLSDEALKYIAGYVAFRVQSAHPHLGTKLVTSLPLPGIKPSWIEWLSRGGLMMPSDEWFSQVKQLEHDFKTFHGTSFRRGAGALRGFINTLHTKYSNVPFSAIRCFITTRTFIRIKEQNRSLYTEKKQRLLSNKIKKLTS